MNKKKCFICTYIYETEEDIDSNFFVCQECSRDAPFEENKVFMEKKCIRLLE